LNQLNKDYLKDSKYITQVFIDGPDKRGINVAFLSRFPLVGTPILHPIPWEPKNEEDKKWMERSRRILEVTVRAPNGSPITFFVAHFPSQSNPTYWREQVAKFLAELVKSKGPEANVVAAGDLNITHEEEQEFHIFRDILGQSGAISHFIGCEKCQGTHHFKKSWSFLDAHIYSKGLLSDGQGTYELDRKSIDVIRYNPIHLKRGKYPNRWNDETMTGVSDHFPLYARLKVRKKSLLN
jgi:endonuclease/exonuclease/phosphatase family metal-dependent hydrolase